MTQRGKVISFDPVRGYGFVAPDGGGEDVFLHVNDLLDDKQSLRAGAVVEFVAQRGDRGMTATETRIIEPASPRGPGAGRVSIQNRGQDLGEDEYEILTEAEYLQEVTEVLLAADPLLSARQILEIRTRLARLATRFGWIER